MSTLPKGLYKDLYNPYVLFLSITRCSHLLTDRLLFFYASSHGRGFPDVAAQGDRYRIFLRGIPRSIGGTSASSPTFAGIVALLNDHRLRSHLAGSQR